MFIGTKLIFLGVFSGSLVVGFLGFTVSTQAAEAAINSETARVQTKPHDDTAPGNPGIEKETPESKGEAGECLVSAKFPQKVRQWCDLITQFAHRYHLPPDLVAAVIWQESGGNPNAYSSSGAVGLMQIMARDGLAAGFTCANGPCFANRPTTQQLENPEFNIKYGTRMLASLVQRYDNYREALKSYGPLDVGYSYADRIIKIYKLYGTR